MKYFELLSRPSWLLVAASAWATIFSTVRGIVHDPSHRPVSGARGGAPCGRIPSTCKLPPRGDDGSFEFLSVPAGEYMVDVTHAGFAEEEQPLVVVSSTAPVLHFQLELAPRKESVVVAETPEGVNPESMTPSTLINRAGDRAARPAPTDQQSRTMITDYVPGAYMTHDQLHVRGGHQVTWAIDGVPIPNTNIASNVGPQIDPKDIDTLEVQRGGYSAEYGDRTYGVFNVVPRTGFESNRQMEVNTTFGSFYQTNDQINFGDHTRALCVFRQH